MSLRTSLSNDFITVGVSTTGMKSLRLLISVFLGTGTMVADLKHLGTMHCDSERLKMFVNASVSCSTQSLSTLPGTPSEPAAFLGLVLRSAHVTSSNCLGVTHTQYI